MKSSIASSIAVVRFKDRTQASARRKTKCRLKQSLLLIVAVAGVSLFLTSGDSGTHWKSGEYAIGWIDNERWLSITLEDGGGHGRAMHEVIAVGEDSKWIVAAQHPNGKKEMTRYYYLSKADDEPRRLV